MRLLLVLVLISVISCTTAPVAQNKTDLRSEEYTKSFTSVSATGWNKKNCSTPASKYNSLGWKKLIEEGNACYNAEKWTQLEEIAKYLSHSEVNSPWGPYYHALLAERFGSLDRSLWMIELSLKRSPKTGLFHYQKGRVLWKKNEYSESVKSFSLAVQNDPNLVDAHLFLGQAFFRDQDFANAAQYFQAVLKVRPKDPTALMGLAECHLQTSDAKGALELLEKGDRNYPGDPAFLIRQAYVYEFVLNDIVKAINMYTQIQEGYTTGKYQRQLDFSLSQKIRDLEMSVKNNRSLAGANSGVKQ